MILQGDTSLDSIRSTDIANINSELEEIFTIANIAR